MVSTFNRRGVLGLGAGAAATGLLGLPALAQDKIRMTIVTGGTGGVFFPYGGGLAKILTEKLPNAQVTAQVTGGSVDNVKLLGAGDAEIGFSTIDSAYDGLTGTGAYKDGKQDVRVIATLYDSFMHLVANAGSGVTDVASLKGKRVSVGSAGSSTESIADRIIKAAGLDPMKDVGRDNLGVAESANALKDGKVAAFFWIGGIPTAAVRDLATSGQPALKFLDTSKELAVMQKEFPGLYTPFKLPKAAYAGMTEDVAGLGVPNVLIAGAQTDPKLIQLVLETMFANLEAVQAIHPAAKSLALKTAATKLAVPMHPGAEAFYKAKGVL